jgi:hypothetical protein
MRSLHAAVNRRRFRGQKAASDRSALKLRWGHFGLPAPYVLWQKAGEDRKIVIGIWIVAPMKPGGFVRPCSMAVT